MEMTDNNNATPDQEQPLHLEEPLLSATMNSNGGTHRRNGGPGPRILDRDGAFAQSRGRWSVSNTRQRHHNHSSSSGANRNGGDGGTPSLFATSPRRLARATSAARCLYNRLLTCCYPCCFVVNNSNNNNSLATRRCWDDWFHTLSYTPTCILMLGVFVAYFVTIVIFAGLYLMVNKVGERYKGDIVNPNELHDVTAASTDAAFVGGVIEKNNNEVTSVGTTNLADVSSFCGMDINDHMEALYFSLSTMATIGYGTSDYYFGECWTPFILVLLQVFSAIAFSSLAIGLLFQRMSRGQKRGRTIVFSDVAIIRKVRGRWYWMFRVAELRKQHIIGAKIRVFCVRHERCPLSEEETSSERGGVDEEDGRNWSGSSVVELETAHFVSHPLPLLNGSFSGQSSSLSRGDGSADSGNFDCSLEQSILMGLPHVIVHRMDPLSPMMPPRPIWYDERGVPHGPASSPSESLTSGASGTAESATSLLAIGDVGRTTPSQESHYPMPSSEEISLFLQDRQAEVIIYLEGTCEVTGLALQARHSYRMEDIAFHQTFAPCVFPITSSSSAAEGEKRWNPFSRSSKIKKESNVSLTRDTTWDETIPDDNCALEVDFTQFHELIPAPYDCSSCPYIPLSS